MADYRIVARLDPETGPGTAKVKQDLQGIQTEAKATQTAINKAFDQQAFDRSIGTLVTRLEQLDRTLTGNIAATAMLAKSNETLGQSLDRTALAAVREANAQRQAAGETKRNATENTQLEAALRRVLQATDQEAAEQLKLNALLADAKRLLDAGAISQERYAQVQMLAANTGKAQASATGAQRIGMQQLGYQLGDVATMYSLGAKPAQIFGSQIGQITQAVQLMSGGTSKFASFLGGPWGIAISVGLIALTPLVAKLFESGDALDDEIDKLKKDAAQTEATRQAKEIYNRTLEGQIELEKRLGAELQKNILTQRQQQQITLNEATQRLENLRKGASDAERELTSAREAATAARARVLQPTALTTPEQAQANVAIAARADERLAAAQKALADARAAIASSERTQRATAIPIMQQNVEDNLDTAAKAAAHYQTALGRLNNAYVNGQITQQRYNDELARERKLRDDTTKAAQEAERAAKASDGVARFRTRQQAIGVAGRELIGQGLQVSENEQFGGVTGGHANNAEHAKYMIDVNQGRGVTEANVPNIKAMFDQRARLYQSRGFKVLWNGQVYSPGGSGPTGPITGKDKHYDHMHIEAPGTIVGKAQQTSLAQQENREESQAQKEGDFIQSVVDQAATRGVRTDSAHTRVSQIDKVLADFKRQFNRDATKGPGGEAERITKALTDAEAREIAEHFKTAYVDPLERLRALQGTVGQQREILNRQLEEAARLGVDELNPAQKEQIANSVKQGDALTREAQILADVHGPIEEYKAQLAALNKLLAEGSINQTTYNARVSDLGRGARDVLRDMPSADRAPGSDKTFGQLSAEADEKARYEKQRDDIEKLRRQRIDIGIDFDKLEEAAERQHQARMIEIQRQAQLVRVQEAHSVADSLLSIAENSVGKQNAVYKALFVASKAFAIAEAIISIQTGISKALAKGVFGLPEIALIAAQGAVIVSNIASIALNLKDGGFVSGPGGPRDDKVPVWASNGEFMVNAAATRENRPLLEAINSGQTIRAAQTVRADASAARSPTNVTIEQHPGVAIEIQRGPTLDDVKIIARQMVYEHSDAASAAAMHKPNSKLSKAVTSTTTASSRKR